MKKTRLDLDALSVDSFATTADEIGARGTVRGNVDPEPTPPQYEDECTCAASCPCPTNAYHCATVRYTAISCTYTYNISCVYDSKEVC
jgi:hypothetical protein